MDQVGLKLAEVLKRPIFQGAQIVAGYGGLDRIVRWVHVLEVSELDSLLHGNELILSTGGGFRDQPELQKQYIYQLIEKKVSGLCIELGYHIKEIPPIMLEIAEQENFPLIHLVKPVRFIDVTQDVNALIINRHYQMLEQLDQVSRDFQRLTLRPKASYHILKLLSEKTGVPANLTLFTGETSRYPESKGMGTDGAKHILSQPVQAMGRIWGELHLELDQPSEDSYMLLLLDRATVAVSQDFLRKLTLIERELHTDNPFIEMVINGEIELDEQGWNHFGFHPVEAAHFKLLFLIVEMKSPQQKNQEEENETVRLHTSILLRTYLEASGFKSYFLTKKNELVLLLIDLRTQQEQNKYRKRMQNSLHQVEEWIQKQNNLVKLRFGVSGPFTSWSRGKLAYLEAVHALSKGIGNKEISFYKDAGVERILWNQANTDLLEGFVADYLGPVLHYDRTKGTELLKTLDVIYSCDGSKSESAERLFIHRQTLYYRVEKLKQLLGEDFLCAEKRLAIEMALKAYYYLFKR